ncbi:hypothetical protein HanIR_Chr03g0148181 [Helianthus annuus]|nr:hypothetical protein HanIR_Chr03g0148181 [Helianthus annuus]
MVYDGRSGGAGGVCRSDRGGGHISGGGLKQWWCYEIRERKRKRGSGVNPMMVVVTGGGELVM